MAAVLTPHIHDPRRGHLPRPRPQLHLVEGGRSAMAARYRRRRLGAALVALAFVVALWSAVGAVRSGSDAGVQLAAGDGSAVATAAVGAPALPGSEAVTGATRADPGSARAYVVVQPGDTLWSIATDLQPEGDVRRVVDELADRVGGGSIQVGQRISIEGIVD